MTTRSFPGYPHAITARWDDTLTLSRPINMRRYQVSIAAMHNLKRRNRTNWSRQIRATMHCALPNGVRYEVCHS